MPMLFNYESALSDKQIAKKDLPSAIKDKIRTFNGLCRKLNQTDEEDYEVQTQLNQEIEDLDAEITEEINDFTPEPPATDPPATDPPKADPPATDPPKADPPSDKKEGVTGGQILFGAVILAGIGYAIKKMMGK